MRSEFISVHNTAVLRYYAERTTVFSVGANLLRNLSTQDDTELEFLVSVSGMTLPLLVDTYIEGEEMVHQGKTGGREAKFRP